VNKEPDDTGGEAERYWDERYQRGSPNSSGKPGAALHRFCETLTAGRALELGCGRGDDAVWLAGHGWMVVAIEISRTAISYATANAERAGVAERIEFEQHDLSQSFPDGRFDLVTASFLAASPREAVLRRAAEAVTPGGHLLIIDHATRLPWSSTPTEKQFSTAEDILTGIALKERNWANIFAGELERHATGPNGETALVRDSVIFLKRL
jgi:SAM-dependent methyltransferase